MNRKGNKDEVRVARGNKVLETQSTEYLAMNVLYYRVYILDRLKTCWDFKTGKYINVFSVIADLNSLLYSYYKSSKYNDITTAVRNQDSIDGMDIDKMKRLQKRLIRESWIPGTGKKVFINKTAFSDKCSLTIISNLDKIVAVSIQQALELIYEGSFEKADSGNLVYNSNRPVFFDNSHGFRPHLGCHTAIGAVERMGALNWLLKGDIEQCFDTIYQKRLLNILKENIEDQKLQNILNKLFQTPIKYLKISSPDIKIGIGLSQGNPLSSILLNIFLHELDAYANNLKKEIYIGKRFNMHQNKVFRNFIRVTNKEINVKKGRKVKTHKEKSIRRHELYQYKMKEAKKLKLIPQFFSEDNQIMNRIMHYKIYYVRYVEEFLVGIRGPVVLAYKIRESLYKYLKFKLLLNIKPDSKVYHACSDVVPFLGYEIRVPRKQDKGIAHARRELSFKKLRNRILAKQHGLKYKYAQILQARIKTSKYLKVNFFLGRKEDVIEKFSCQDVIRELEVYVDYLKKTKQRDDLVNPLNEFQK